MNPITADSSSLGARGVAYASAISGAARRHGLDPNLLAAVAAQETGGPDSNRGANVVGDGGHGHGLFQIDDRWHAFASSPAAADPAKNADYAAGMISGLLARYGGNVHEALSAYNAGSPTAVGTTTTWSDGKTLGYADSVLRHEQRIAGTTAVPNAEMPDAPPSADDLRSETASTSESVNALAFQALALAESALAGSMANSMPSLPQMPSLLRPPSDAQTTDASILDNEGDD